MDAARMLKLRDNLVRDLVTIAGEADAEGSDAPEGTAGSLRDMADFLRSLDASSRVLFSLAQFSPDDAKVMCFSCAEFARTRPDYPGHQAYLERTAEMKSIAARAPGVPDAFRKRQR